MKTTTAARAFAAALIGLSIMGAPKLAFADIKDYEFQLVDLTVQAGADKIVTVRLLNKKTGKPVPDAVIFASRLDMAPDGMQEMVTKVTPTATRWGCRIRPRCRRRTRWGWTTFPSTKATTATTVR